MKALSGFQANYLDRTNRHSVNLMAICDSEKKFTYISAGFPGSAHDNRVFKSTPFFRLLEQNPEALFPNTNMHIIVEQLNVIFGKNRSVGDTSMKFGMKVVCKSLFQKKVLAIKNSNIAAIFFKMVARSLKIAKNSKNRSSLSIYFQLLGRAE